MILGLLLVILFLVLLNFYFTSYLSPKFERTAENFCNLGQCSL